MNIPLTPLEFLNRASSLYGQKEGIVDGDKRFTYAEYHQRVNQFGNALTSLGVGQGDVVSFFTCNCHQLLEAYFAVPQIEGILNPLNIRLSAKEIEYILGNANTKVICFLSDYLPIIEEIRDNLPHIEHFIVMESEEALDWAHDYEALLAQESPHAEIDMMSIDENAVVELFYTSGTTGRPKGVMITNRTLYLHTMSAIPGFGVRDEDALLHVVPLFHVNGWGTPQFLTAVGGKHVILRQVDFDLLLQLIEEEKITKLLGVPTIFNGLVTHPTLNRYDLSSLNECVIGGAPSPLSLIVAIEEKLNCKAYVGYGLTETSPFILIARPKDYLIGDLRTEQALQAKTGLPNIGVQIRIVDAEGNDVPKDEKSMGEIVVRSNNVMSGYHNDQAATDEIIQNGWFHTGDMGVMDTEGYITIVDRKKDIIISGGENISSVEVEKVIQDHPAIYEAVIIGVPSEKWGESPKAIVVLNPGEIVTEEEIIAHVKTHLASYKAPKSVEFRDSLPKGGTGKISKREIRAPYWDKHGKKIN